MEHPHPHKPYLKQLTLHQFRKFSEQTFHFESENTVIIGNNGSGKTSILEAIHLLLRGRSFRSQQLSHLIQHQKKTTTLILEDSTQNQISTQKSLHTKMQLKLNQTPCTQTEIAQQHPIQLLDPESLRIHHGNSKLRRQNLDWSAFYAEPSYAHLWQRNQKILMQRNTLLKSLRSAQNVKPDELEYWNLQWLDSCEQIHTIRQHTFEKINDLLTTHLPEFIQKHQIELTYLPGWTAQKALKDTLAASLPHEIKAGHTLYGTHRADIQINSHGKPAKNILSRGQQKLFACFFKLAQCLAFQQNCTLLIDDIAAELDQQHLQEFFKHMHQHKINYMLTAIPEQYKYLKQYMTHTFKMMLEDQLH